jgi:hypothetical protein
MALKEHGKSRVPYAERFLLSLLDFRATMAKEAIRSEVPRDQSLPKIPSPMHAPLVSDKPVNEAKNISGYRVLTWETVTILAVVVCLIAGLTFYFTKRTLDWPEKIAHKLGTLFQSTVNVSNASFTLNQKDIAELAVVQRRIICTTRYDASWLGSDATVILQGVYTVKAGYDLKDGFRLDFDEHGKVVSVKLPEPKILSNTTESQKVLYASQGVLKKIPPKEMELVYTQNLEQAKREANDLGLLAEAKTRIKERLNDLLGEDVSTINIPAVTQ